MSAFDLQMTCEALEERMRDNERELHRLKMEWAGLCHVKAGEHMTIPRGTHGYVGRRCRVWRITPEQNGLGGAWVWHVQADVLKADGKMTQPLRVVEFKIQMIHETEN